MSNGASQYSFENLTQSGLIRVNSKDDKNVTMSIDTFGGNTSLCVFTGAGGRPWKVTLSRKVIANLVILLRKMAKDIRPCREPIMLNEWDQEAKRMKQMGQIGIGIDENLTFTIDVAHNNLSGRHIFPIKGDGRWDFSNTTLSEKEGLEAIIEWIIEVLSFETVVAERLSSFKRQAGGAGGNRGNYSNQGGNRSYNNNSGGGNNQQQSSGGTFSGGDEFTDELHV